MTRLDWLVLAATLLGIVGYGAWRARHVRTVDAYLRGGGDLRWYTIGLSIMATQASAITFLSMPGQAYEEGMGFVQFYFGLPIAMVLLSATIVPVFVRAKVYTAYEYLEGRFDRRTRQLTALLFLFQRGLAAGISLYAPALVLSVVLGWPVRLTTLVIGLLVIVYTVSGGTRAVSQTQTWQMVVMLGGMALAFIFVLHRLPPHVSLGDAVDLAGRLGRMKVVDFSPRWDTRYTFWSGITGGLFVALAYFGTDQSQVQRYLSGGSLASSRLGLLFNGLVKVPMQFLILFVGLMVFVLYQFGTPQLYWNRADLAEVRSGPAAGELRALEERWDVNAAAKRSAVDALLTARHAAAPDPTVVGDASRRLGEVEGGGRTLRKEVKALISRARGGKAAQDADYIFITFVLHHFPSGLVGLLLAVILCASMSACASALNALGSTSVVDFYRRSVRPAESDRHYLRAAQLFTVFWGAVALAFALFATLVDNLIQAVNILGSIFYGPTLGVFLVGIFIQRVRATPIFWALVIGQALVIAVFATSSIGFLWYNVIGCAAVVGVALAIDQVSRTTTTPQTPRGSEGAV